MSATSVNPNNWHWTSKDCRIWTREYLDNELTKVSVDEGAKKAAVTRVISCEGDVDVAMRKRKVITIYDLKIQIEFNGEVDGTEASGSITCPEVSYDLGPSDYVLETDLYEASKEKEPVKQFVREKLHPKIREFFGNLSQVLLENHGNDVYLSTEEHNGNAARGLPSHSSLTSQQTVGKTSTNTPSKVATSLPTSSGSDGTHASATVNTSDISENFSFDAPADELYATFLDPARVAAWSRAPPQLDVRPQGPFSLFHGNVVGRFLVLEQNKRIVQTWRLSAWPTGHYAEISFSFDQADTYTTLRMVMKGVPIGEEETVQNNIQNYYIRPIKTIFGFGAVL
ncbi:chaperone activator Aha1 [Schizosaccharomyces octosporus yFS286]|uniref:Chaperone activator Aha1 n=1 Tax=Schizosaccharomyces octosporus (strain yFS286) TaxID=483514 RepID=S9RMF4_SCHOY|nr:chaperone activator Aha1 [Schizosaccharomyces octosporus yFS286]EPX75094.1 chaperone activator Aha1 [Schizosaccharomyces octosporus yFS286]